MPKTWIILCLVALCMQACSPAILIPEQNTPGITVEPIPPSTTVSEAKPQVTATVLVESTSTQPAPAHLPTETQTALPPTATPTQRACMLGGGQVEVSEFSTVLLPQPLIFRVYLPPCYEEDSLRAYPVLYLIHGQTYTDDQWDRLGAPEAADKLIRAGEVPPFIIVMPRDRVWLEPDEDRFGLAVEQSLIPWIDEHYRTMADRAHRAVGGLSRGGAWAVHLGLSHPELFSAIGVHSGFVFFSDVQLVHQWLRDIPAGDAPRVYLDLGDDDRPEITEGALWLEKVLTQYDIPHEWHMFVGEHEEAYWRAHVEDYLHWYAMEW